MKKIVAILMAALLLVTVAGCQGGASKDRAGTTQSAAKESAEGQQTKEAEKKTDSGSKPTLETIKIGFVHNTDPSDMGYCYMHDQGTQKMMKDLGISADRVINKFNIPEAAEAATAMRELAEEGCHIIFATSFGFEDFMLEVAAEYPDIQFCHASGYQAKDSGLANMHNYFGLIYQARYLGGIAAGMKTKTNKLGYVAAMPYAEIISGFDAFYLGAKSVNPKVTMQVVYTNSWNDPTMETQVTKAMIEQGADVICMQTSSTAPMTTAEANGVFAVGENTDMKVAAPKAVLTSAVWDWSVYLEYAVKSVVNAETIPTDWSKGLADGVVDITPLNEAIVAPGTEEAIKNAREKILSGKWDVFTGPLKDNEGKIVVKEGETFIEPQAAPSFESILEGITIVK